MLLRSAAQFQEYLNSRADLTAWLTHLCNQTLVCHCGQRQYHARCLAEAVWGFFGSSDQSDSSSSAAPSASTDATSVNERLWDAEESVLGILERFDFVPSGKRSREVVAAHAASGSQPRGSALPSLLPDGLGPGTHLRMALSTTHPFARPPSLPLLVKYAIQH